MKHLKFSFLIIVLLFCIITPLCGMKNKRVRSVQSGNSEKSVQTKTFKKQDTAQNENNDINKNDSPVKRGSIDKSTTYYLRGESTCREEIVTAISSMDSVTMVMEIGDVKRSGISYNRDYSRVKYEYISSDSMYYTTLADSTFSKDNFWGNFVDSLKLSPLTGLRILIIKDSNGVWSSADSNILTDRQRETVNEKMEAYDDGGNEYYLDKPVKIGEQWDVDASVLKGLLGDDFGNLSGSGTLTLEEILSYNGEKCALLSGAFNVKGVDSTGINFLIDIDINTIRSLERFHDLQINIEGTLSLTFIEKSEDGTMSMSSHGPMKLNVFSDPK